MSYAHYFRVKAELFEILNANSENSAVDRAWYAGLIRSYKLLAAAEDRHYYKAPRSNSVKQAPVSTDHAASELVRDIARLWKSRSAA